jgi:hypothetical protein
MRKKFLAVSAFLSLLCTESFAQSKIENVAFTKWIESKTQTRQMLGIGLNEGGLGVQYGINTDFTFYGTEETNFYTFLELSNNRIEFAEGYDMLQNYGLKGIQFIPAVGISTDTSSAAIGFFTEVKLRWNFSDSFGAEVGYKYFIQKPTEGSGDTSNTKGYITSYISYQF